MNKADLIALGIDPAIANQIIVLHGKDIEKHKTSNSTLQTENDSLKTQLTEAGTTIEGFKKMDVAAIRKAADDYKAAAEKTKTESDSTIKALKLQHALERELGKAQVKNAKAVQALLKLDDLKFNEGDESFAGLQEQLDKVKASDSYLFQDDTQTPQIITGGKQRQINTDAITAAARKGANLPDPKP